MRMEAYAQCLNCLATETIEVDKEGKPVHFSRKFTLLGNELYHDCAGNKPVKIYKVNPVLYLKQG